MFQCNDDAHEKHLIAVIRLFLVLCNCLTLTKYIGSDNPLDIRHIILKVKLTIRLLRSDYIILERNNQHTVSLNKIFCHCLSLPLPSYLSYISGNGSRRKSLDLLALMKVKRNLTICMAHSFINFLMMPYYRLRLQAEYMYKECAE